MRMNYKKRLWPMLALLPVFALAAIAMHIGLPGVNTPTAEAQSVVVAESPLPTGVGTSLSATVAAPLTATPTACKLLALAAAGTYTGDQCTTSGDALTVTFVTNRAATATTEVGAKQMLVYVTGGTYNRRVQAQDAASMSIGKLGIDRHLVTIPAANITRDGEASITVNRSMSEDGGNGDVYLIVYDDIADYDTSNIAADAATWTATAAISFAVKVQFKGPPVEKTRVGSADTVRSKITTVDDIDTTTAALPVDVAAGATTAMVGVSLHDSNGKPIAGYIDLEVGGGASVVFSSGETKRLRLNGEADGGTEAAIKGLPLTGAFLIPVTATIGDLTLTGHLRRIGSQAATVTVAGYVCALDEDAGDDMDDHCMDERNDLNDASTSNDPESLTVVAPGTHILLAGNALDAAGNKGTGLNLKWSAVDAEILDETDVTDVDFEHEGSTPDALDFAVIQVADNATLGEYNLTVEDTDDNASETVTFIVTGDAAQLEITGPDIIDPVTGWGTYTVTATDRNGNLPNNVLDDPNTSGVFEGLRISVIVRVAGDPMVTGLKADGTLDFASNGEAEFTIVMPYGTRLGSPVSIVVSGGSLNASKMATYGTVAPALGPATGLAATSNTAGTVMLSWTAGPGSTRHFVAGVRKSEHEAGNYDNIIWTAASSNSAHTVTGLTDGEVYLFTVISGNATRWSSWYRPIIEVTVNPTAGGGGGPGNPFS